MIIITLKFNLQLLRILHLKQMFAILKRQLSEHSNGAKHVTVLLKIVSVLLPQNLPLLETFIACFVSAPNPLLHSLAIGGVGNARWASDIFRCMSPVAIISLNTFALFQFTH